MPAAVREPVLAVIERAYRGAVEGQFFDSLYLTVELNRQLGEMHILLRGEAVTYAMREGHVPALRFGDRLVTTLNDPRSGVRRLIEAGVPVYAQQEDLAELGVVDQDRLLPGVRVAAADETALRWPAYRMVIFL